jgi:RNA polymerase sigma factor (sigma-70 family)
MGRSFSWQARSREMALRLAAAERASPPPSKRSPQMLVNCLAAVGSNAKSTWRRELAEDVTSETFLRALRRITINYQGRDAGAWLVTIARNLVLDHVKSSRFRLEVTSPDIRDTERVEASPEQQLMSKLTRQALLDCVSQLGDDQRECIVLRFLQAGQSPKPPRS